MIRVFLYFFMKLKRVMSKFWMYVFSYLVREVPVLRFSFFIALHCMCRIAGLILGVTSVLPLLFASSCRLLAMHTPNMCAELDKNF